MKRLIEKRYFVKAHAISLIALSLAFYFSYHLVQGKRSYPRLVVLQSQVRLLEGESDQVKQERVRLEEKVRKLQEVSLDEDLLAERARLVLGYRQQGEIDMMLHDYD